jgi:hypothetical protein
MVSLATSRSAELCSAIHSPTRIIAVPMIRFQVSRSPTTAIPSRTATGQAIGQWRTGRLPQRSTHTLSHFLQEEWLPAVKPRLRPSTWANYRTYIAAYVEPILGQVKLQALTPVQLNHLYAHLLERGRRKTIDGGRTGLSPKTVRNVHVMLHSALHDAMRWGYLVRNVAEAADPPPAAPREHRVLVRTAHQGRRAAADSPA